MQIGDCKRNETEGGDHKAATRQKKLKAKTLKWRSSNTDMNSKVEAGGSDRVYHDTVLRSLTAANFNSLISRKRLRTHGKVAQQCDAIDPPVPRRIRSAINKRVRHVKRRRHLSAIGAQISFVDQRARFNETSLLTEEEVADALLSLSRVPSTCEFTADNIIADSTQINGTSTSNSEGGTKEGDKITLLPNASDELCNQAACIVRQTESIPHVNPVPGDTNQPNNINPQLLENARIKDHSSGVVANLPSPCKNSSHNSVRKQLKMQLQDSKNYPAQEQDSWLVYSNKSDNSMHKNGEGKNDSGQEDITRRVQTPLPGTADGHYSIKPLSSKVAVEANPVSELPKVTASENLGKLPLVNNGVPTKTWKRNSTHVYVSHLIQMHLNKEKAAQHRQVVKPEERPHVHASCSRPPSCCAFGLLQESGGAAQDEARCAAVHLDVPLPVQPTTTAGVCRSMSAAVGQQTMVRSSSGKKKFLMNMPAPSASTPGAGAQQQHVPYMHPPQMAPRVSYPFPHGRANLAPAATLGQMAQYMCNNQGYAPHSSGTMKLHQQLIPTAQQQQQMWQQFHMGQYQARGRPDSAPPGAAWHHNVASLRPVSVVLPGPATISPQMELLCALYQGGGRQPHQQHLRLM